MPTVDWRSGGVDDGSSLAADVVVVGIGVVPSVGWLDGLGARPSTTAWSATRSLFAADRVVAAGDVARWRLAARRARSSVRIEHWQLAAERGSAAARSLLAGPGRRPAVRPGARTSGPTSTGPRSRCIGHPGPDDEVVVVDGSLAEGRFVALYGRRARLTAALAIGRPRQLMAYRPLLAAGASFDEALAPSRG